MKKRHLRIGYRATGVSTPSGGVSWEKVPDVEREVLMRLLPFLEDRRVLYSPSEVEVPAHCVESVLHIREFLVSEAGRLDEGNELRETLRAMARVVPRILGSAARSARSSAAWPP